MVPGKGPERRTVRDVPVAATVCLVAIGLLSCAVAVMYFAEPAHDLPGLIPGSGKGVMRHHIKHGILSAALGLAALFAAVSSAGRRPATTSAVGGPIKEPAVVDVAPAGAAEQPAGQRPSGHRPGEPRPSES
jgi:hypothetical protein